MVSDDDDGLMSYMFTHLSGSLLASCSNDQVLPVVCVCVCVCYPVSSPDHQSVGSLY